MSQDEFKHYGILHESGRYPWGSGGDPYQRSQLFYGMIDDLRNTFRKIFGMDMPEREVATAMGLSVADLRDTKTIAKEEIVKYQSDRAKKLKEKGVSIKEIANDLDIPQPTVRLRLKNYDKQKQSSLRTTAELIRANVDEHKIVDIGKGTELNIDAGLKMGISPEKLRAAVSVLRDEGYVTYTLQVPQVGTRQFTNQQVIVPPGTTFKEARSMVPQIHTLGEWSEDDGASYLKTLPPLSVSSKRLKVIYKEDGGTEQDGVVHIRPGVKDLDMGKNTYAQVRIMVDGTHFIKGMALLNHDMPDGVDMVFHSNKSRSVGKLGALKPLESDPDLPFGSVIKRQILEQGKDGAAKVKSALNIVEEAGGWADWRKSLPSQMLAKQPHSLIKSQLTTTREQLMQRLDEINQITNPVVQRNALNKFADEVDSDAVDLRAASMPRQQTKVILPMPKMNKTEIYAPDFETGERVVLIRYPHGGRFEIPEVTVNNNNRTAKKLLGDAPDAIGIHPAVAERLSGADFDGDTVVVIPNRQGLIRGASTESKVYDNNLKGFNPKDQYGGYEEKDGKGTYKLMTQTGLEMGRITNLITDMQVQQASPEHIVRAVKHSMVVIDAEKHKLDYKKSEHDNNIKQLIQLYQSHPETGKRPGGASTLLSQSTAKVRVPQRKLRPAGQGGPIDPKTGELIYVPTKRTSSKYDPKTGTYEKVVVNEEVKRGRLTDDAYTLVRDRQDPVESLYADHTNAMKDIGNSARLQAARIPNPSVNSRAKEVYAPEVDKLVADLRTAQRQKPLDRRAQVYADQIVKAKKTDDPLLYTDADRRKKVERQALATSRARLGLEKPVIPISDRQWDAIQSGAVSASRLQDILDYADQTRVMELAMPRTNAVMTSAISARAAAMLATGKSIGDVAAALGIPVGTLKSAQARGDVK